MIEVTEVFCLPAQGTLILVQGGLALLGAAFAVRYAFKRLAARRRR